MTDRISALEFKKAGLHDWEADDTRATAEYACGTFSAAGRSAARVAEICDEQGHHVEIDIRPPDLLRVTTTTHDVGGLTSRDLELARAVSRHHEIEHPHGRHKAP